MLRGLDQCETVLLDLSILFLEPKVKQEFPCQRKWHLLGPIEAPKLVPRPVEVPLLVPPPGQGVPAVASLWFLFEGCFGVFLCVVVLLSYFDFIVRRSEHVLSSYLYTHLKYVCKSERNVIWRSFGYIYFYPSRHDHMSFLVLLS